MTGDRLCYIVAALALAFALGLLVGRAQVAQDAPRCPTEDSCRADYRGGSWHIEPVTSFLTDTTEG